MAISANETAKIVDDATKAAVFFRTLVGEGIPVSAACGMTASFISSQSIGERHDKGPGEPWEGGGK